MYQLPYAKRKKPYAVFYSISETVNKNKKKVSTEMVLKALTRWMFTGVLQWA